MSHSYWWCNIWLISCEFAKHTKLKTIMPATTQEQYNEQQRNHLLRMIASSLNIIETLLDLLQHFDQWLVVPVFRTAKVVRVQKMSVNKLSVIPQFHIEDGFLLMLASRLLAYVSWDSSDGFDYVLILGSPADRVTFAFVAIHIHDSLVWDQLGYGTTYR
jgi:hypothetical protein